MGESMGTSEVELVRAAAGGDSVAFGQLVERYMRRAYYVALGLVGSHEAALDLSQDAFARAFRHREHLDPTRPFYPWLYQILRRLCFNFLRDSASRRKKLAQAGNWLADEVAERQTDDPSSSLERARQREAIARAIEELSDREREVFVLKEFEGLKYREIAELLDIPIGTVMSRLYKARKKLANALEGES